MTTTPDALVVDGRIVSAADRDDAYLRPGQVAARLGVPTEYPSRWAAAQPGDRYGPGGAHPYPAHVPGAHVVVGGQVYVLASAVDAWAVAVAGGVGLGRGPRATWAAALVEESGVHG